MFIKCCLRTQCKNCTFSLIFSYLSLIYVLIEHNLIFPLYFFGRFAENPYLCITNHKPTHIIYYEQSHINQ